MTDKTHQTIGLAAATAGWLVSQPDTPVTWGIAGTVLLGSFIGSIFPDIDQPTAGIWRAVPMGKVMNQLVCRVLGGHRNLSHSILGVLIFYLLINLAGYWIRIDHDLFVMSAMIGFVAHLIADSVTVQGIPLLWPFGDNMGFPPRPFHGIRILTGKWFENLVVFPLSILVVIILIFVFKQHFCLILPGICR